MMQRAKRSDAMVAECRGYLEGRESMKNAILLQLSRLGEQEPGSKAYYLLTAIKCNIQNIKC